MAVLQFFEGIRTEYLNKFFEAVTIFGEETVMIVLIVALWFAFDKSLAKKLFFVSVTSVAANSIIKNIAKVPRPFSTGKVTCVRTETATGYSFPSGHTQSFTTWSAALAKNIKNIYLTVAVVILIPLVAVSRVYLGAHYPSDVLVGMALGLLFAFIGDYVYENVKNKDALHIAIVLIMSVFAVAFFFSADPLYSDFYKIYGMIFGAVTAIKIEEKYAPITYNVGWGKKLIRVIIGIAVAYILKEGIKALNVFGNVQITFIIDAVRYFVLVFAVVGICPVIFKKCKL